MTFQSSPELMALYNQEMERRKRINSSQQGGGALDAAPNAMAGGRVIDYGPYQALGKVAKALIGNYQRGDSDEKLADIQSQHDAGRSSAVDAVMQTYEGMPAEGVMIPEIEGDTKKALLQASTDPYLQDGNMSAVLAAMLKADNKGGSGANPYYRFLNTAEGIVTGNARTGELTQPENTFIRSEDSPELQRKLAEQKQLGKGGAKAVTEPAIDVAVNKAAMSDVNSPEFIQQKKDHTVDLKANEAVKLKTTQALEKINYILSDDNKDAFNSNFGGWNAYATQFTPNDDVSNMRNKITSLKSDLKSAGLELARAGGSIGQITQAEWPIMEGMIEAISPSLGEQGAREAFGNVVEYMNSIVSNTTGIYNSKWEQTSFFQSDEVKPAFDDADKQKRFEEYKRRKAAGEI